MKQIKIGKGKPFVKMGKVGKGFEATASKYGHLGKPGLILKKRR
jgi:hypothetical protein